MAYSITFNPFYTNLLQMSQHSQIPKSQLYVHLSSDKETAKKVGSRHGRPVIYEIDCRKMAADGYHFYESANRLADKGSASTIPDEGRKRLKIMVSACLAGENCKYNGGNNRNEKIRQLMEENEVITVCPEQMGGLPTPRVPSEIKDGCVTARDGMIVDKEFRAGAIKCLEIAIREKPDLIVLQSRSPSCGVKQRYDGTFTGTLVDGSGVTAQLLMDHGFRCLDVEDLFEIHEGIVIRKLGNKEIILLKEFLYEAIFIPEGVQPPARDIVERPELRLYYDGFGNSPADHCLVAEIDGHVVGAVWTRIMKDYGHVDDETPSFAISLFSEYRGQGIGTRLMKGMLTLLKAHGYRQASLAVQKANYAVRMYRNVGFEIIDENDEEYIMVCRLREEVI